jgi:hypothetical protein
MPKRKRALVKSKFTPEQGGDLDYAALRKENVRCNIPATGDIGVLRRTLLTHIETHGTEFADTENSTPATSSAE